ncbi:glycosyltransferase family 4 protein [Roseomonas hellenica]|uniref:Glycosyltransferase family 4 protein n=1 Tax=Plastoroseomonas hellenica TaxID=2687306 RepID=A0ABS5F8B0_9PROT|nr:glycosyltransferase family 4 protein [Plastoroseomonas hellenica]
MSALHRLWRLLPPHLRREALFSLMAAIAPRPAAAVPEASLPITVAGYFRAPSGLGEGTRRLADMLEAAGVPVHRADLTAVMRQGPPGPPPELPADGPGTLILHVNGPMVPWSMRALGRRAVAGKRVFAFWNWELPKLAADWDRGYRFVHGILASSDFVADAVRRPGGPPVATVPYYIPDPEPASITRADLGLPEHAFLALSIFDASSSVERKNPVAAIRAHRQAFGDRADRVLVLKTYKTGMGGAAWAEVLAEAAGAPNIRILDREMSRQEVWGLIRLSDVFVSLHRSEGIGLSPAESMRLGRPVIATGWSGNMDFMDAASAMLVGYRLIPAQDLRGTYSVPGAVWAEPDVAEAAACLTTLAEDPVRRLALAEAGRRRVAHLTAPLCGRHALEALGLAGGGSRPG